MFVPLLPAALAPDLLLSVEVVIDCDLVLLVLVCLLYDALDHGHALHQVLIAVGSHQNIEGFVFINLLSIVDARLALRASPADLDFAVGLLLQLLLGLSLGPNDLPDIVYRGVVGIGDINALVLFGRFVVRRRLVG